MIENYETAKVDLEKSSLILFVEQRQIGMKNVAILPGSLRNERDSTA